MAELHVCVVSVLDHVDQLDGISDLALQALGPGDGELDGLGVPPVLRVLVREVGGHAVAVRVSSDLCMM